MPHHDDFHDRLLATLPSLRVHAVALTRNRAAADDLVHDAVVNALAARDRFTPGTNFGAWMHRILYNRFITASSATCASGAGPTASTMCRSRWATSVRCRRTGSF